MSNQWPQSVQLREVSPRDGLQTIPEALSTEAKVRMIDALSVTGLGVIEACAFVSPKWVPQMADGEAVMAAIQRAPGVRYSALVPNQKGYDRALAAGVDAVVLFASASETYSKKNTNKTIAESLEAQKEVVESARTDGTPVSVDVSMSFGCPYEGPIAAQDVVNLVQALVDLGITEIYLADTTGTGSPLGIREVVQSAQKECPQAQLGLHLHDTRGLALANVMEALNLGIDRFDCSAGGIGGGPYAQGATGNVATEDLVYLCESLGIRTGVDLEKLLEAGAVMEEVLGQSLASKLLRAGLPKGWSPGSVA